MVPLPRSPDGGSVALDSRVEESEIYVMASEEARRARITNRSAADMLPSWSRDGNGIYSTSTAAVALKIWKTAKEGGLAVQVTHSGGYQVFESPDGNLYYTKAFQKPLFKMRVERARRSTGRACSAYLRLWGSCEGYSTTCRRPGKRFSFLTPQSGR